MYTILTVRQDKQPATPHINFGSPLLFFKAVSFSASSLIMLIIKLLQVITIPGLVRQVSFGIVSTFSRADQDLHKSIAKLKPDDHLVRKHGQEEESPKSKRGGGKTVLAIFDFLCSIFICKVY